MLDCQNVKSLKLYIAKMLHNQNVKVPQCQSVKMLRCQRIFVEVEPSRWWAWSSLDDSEVVGSIPVAEYYFFMKNWPTNLFRWNRIQEVKNNLLYMDLGENKLKLSSIEDI